MAQTVNTFRLLEASIDDIQRAYTAGDLSARELTLQEGQLERRIQTGRWKSYEPEG